MAGELLLDTGALVWLLDRHQRLHEPCVAFYRSWDRPVVSTETVLTEATHLLGRLSGGRRACLDFFLEGGAVLVPSSARSLRRARALIARYEDLPMDFADATPVVLAEDLDTRLVFTIDRDFEVYRIGGRTRFDVRPALATRAGRRRR